MKPPVPSLRFWLPLRWQNCKHNFKLIQTFDGSINLGINSTFFLATSTRAYYEIWNDEQCPKLGQGSSNSVGDCESDCIEHPNLTRTAINWRVEPKECVLRACPRPVQNPTWIYKNYRGYLVTHFPGSTLGYLDKGPFSNIWTDEECPNLGQGSTNGNLEDCKNDCHFNKRCNAVNFSSYDCVLRACPLPIPEPSWLKSGYKGYST